MIFPLSIQDEEQDMLTPALAKAGLEYAKSKGRGVGGDHAGVLQALKGCFSVIPDEQLPAWLDALQTTCSAMVGYGISQRFRCPLGSRASHSCASSAPLDWAACHSQPSKPSLAAILVRLAL